MAVTHNDPVVTESKLTDFYTSIKPYLGGSVSTGFTPIGTIIAVMGNSAPANFLACNGQVVNIADYKELANYFFTQFGSYNKFGGNGTTTFGIPDLRGEFLRGTGTNSHTNQGNGANVGTHQDATEIPDVYAAKTDADTMQISIRMDQDAAVGDFSVPSKVDGSVTGTKNSLYSYNTSPKGISTTTKRYKYTARPTNTSVLYCIATKNMFMNEGSNYSTDEQVVGTWVDGKPIYQKTIFFNPVMYVSSTAWSATNEDVSNIENIISGEGYSVDGSRQSRPMCLFLDGVLKIMSGRDNVGSDSISGVTYRYTKITD